MAWKEAKVLEICEESMEIEYHVDCTYIKHIQTNYTVDFSSVLSLESVVSKEFRQTNSAPIVLFKQNI